MPRTSPEGAESTGEDAGRRRQSHFPPHAVLDLRRPFSGAIPSSSVGAVRAVARLDGRTHVVAAREPGGSWWRLRHRTRFTREHARMLREAGVSEVVLRRGLKRASFPLAWLSNRTA